MWKNLRDVGALAQKISDVVAPPPGQNDGNNDEDDAELTDNEDVYTSEGHDDDDDDDEEVDDDDDDAEYESEEDSEEDDGRPGPFGFVTMLTRAIDTSLNKSGPSIAEDEESNTFPEEYQSDHLIDDSEQLPDDSRSSRPTTPQQQQQKQQQNLAILNDISDGVSPVQKDDSLSENKDTGDAEEIGNKGVSGKGDPMSDDEDNDNDSDLDGKGSRLRVVSRLQPQGDNNNISNSKASTEQNTVSAPQPEPSSPQRRIPSHTFSTDSLFQGTYGRQLREQRRQKETTEDEGNHTLSESTNAMNDMNDNLETATETVEVVTGEVSGLSMLDDTSDLDGKDSMPRMVTRLQHTDSKSSSQEKNDSRPQREPLSPERKLRGSTYSTDSLFQGVYGRELREQRRKKEKIRQRPATSAQGTTNSSSDDDLVDDDDDDIDVEDIDVENHDDNDDHPYHNNEAEIEVEFDGKLDVDISEVQIGDASGSSMMSNEDSNLDAREGKRRVVSRLQDGKNDKNNNDATNHDTQDNNESPLKKNRAPISSRRRPHRGSTYSTDSLLQGDFGRQLREQRRQKHRRSGSNDGYTSSSRSPSPDSHEQQQQEEQHEPSQQQGSQTRPYHRIVEVPKSTSVLHKNAPSYLTSDDEQDELDVPLHKGRHVVSLSQQAASSTIQNNSGHNDPGVMETTTTSPRQRNEESSSQNYLPTTCSNHSAPPFVVSSSDDSKRIQELEYLCQQLKQQLEEREHQIIDLQDKTRELVEREGQEHERVMELFTQKEQRLLEAATEDHQYELRMLQEEMMSRIEVLQQELEEERNVFQSEQDKVERLLDEALTRAEKAEQVAQQLRSQNESTASQIQQQHSRALRITEDKLVQALAQIDEKEENERNLKAMIKTLQSKMTEHHEGAQEAEEELDELHAENEELRNRLEKMESDNKHLREKISKLQVDSEKLTHLKLEMRMLKEDNEREKAKRQNVAASAESTSAQLIADRDAALSEVQDLQQQLAAAIADIEMAKGDTDRALLANNNLQMALESLQAEREAELAIWEENKLADEKALEAAHEAALEAQRQTNESQMQLIQKAADAAVKNSMDEIRLLEQKIEMFRVENIQMRRSLDEAITRLQVTQDDVIDRSLMKNILFDWLTKKGVKERRDVLEVMANMLHFSEEEKEQVHIGHSSVLSTIVGPMPEPKADMEHLEGENVREKFLSFLLAETDD